MVINIWINHCNISLPPSPFSDLKPTHYEIRNFYFTPPYWERPYLDWLKLFWSLKLGQLLYPKNQISDFRTNLGAGHWVGQKFLPVPTVKDGRSRNLSVSTGFTHDAKVSSCSYNCVRDDCMHIHIESKMKGHCIDFTHVHVPCTSIILWVEVLWQAYGKDYRQSAHTRAQPVARQLWLYYRV